MTPLYVAHNKIQNAKRKQKEANHNIHTSTCEKPNNQQKDGKTCTTATLPARPFWVGLPTADTLPNDITNRPRRRPRLQRLHRLHHHQRRP